MKIAIVGAGRIGSCFGFHLARVGHDVTLIARGARLAQLHAAGGINTLAGERAPCGSPRRWTPRSRGISRW